MPLGNLTSQFFANVYLDGLDHFCKEVLRANGYLRYVDDFALFHDDPSVLDDWRRRIARYLAGRRLSLHPRKTVIQPTAEPAPFLGYVLMPGGRRLPDDNVRRFRNRWRGLSDRVRAGSLAENEAAHRIRAWIAHAEHAHTWRLRHAIFQGGPFDPALEATFRDGLHGAKREPSRSPLATASTAAAPGTTIRGTSIRRTATGTSPTTEINLGFRVARTPLIAGTGAFTDAPGVPKGVQDRP